MKSLGHSELNDCILLNSDMRLSDIESLFNMPGFVFFKKRKEFSDILKNEFSSSKQLKEGQLIPEHDDNPFITSLIERVKKASFEDYNSFLTEIFETLSF